MAKTETSSATLSIAKTAKLLNLGINQTYEAAHRGDIPCIKIGRRLLVPRVALERMLAGSRGVGDAA